MSLEITAGLLGIVQALGTVYSVYQSIETNDQLSLREIERKIKEKMEEAEKNARLKVVKNRQEAQQIFNETFESSKKEMDLCRDLKSIEHALDLWKKDGADKYEDDYVRAEVNSMYGNMLELQGSILIKLQEYEKAESVLKKALATKASFHHAKSLLVYVQLLQGQFDKARKTACDYFQDGPAAVVGRFMVAYASNDDDLSELKQSFSEIEQWLSADNTAEHLKNNIPLILAPEILLLYVERLTEKGMLDWPHQISAQFINHSSDIDHVNRYKQRLMSLAIRTQEQQARLVGKDTIFTKAEKKLLAEMPQVKSSSGETPQVKSSSGETLPCEYLRLDTDAKSVTRHFTDITGLYERLQEDTPVMRDVIIHDFLNGRFSVDSCLSESARLYLYPKVADLHCLLKKLQQASTRGAAGQTILNQEGRVPYIQDKSVRAFKDDIVEIHQTIEGVLFANTVKTKAILEQYVEQHIKPLGLDAIFQYYSFEFFAKTKSFMPLLHQVEGLLANIHIGIIKMLPDNKFNRDKAFDDHNIGCKSSKRGIQICINEGGDDDDDELLVQRVISNRRWLYLSRIIKLIQALPYRSASKPAMQAYAVGRQNPRYWPDHMALQGTTLLPVRSTDGSALEDMTDPRIPHKIQKQIQRQILLQLVMSAEDPDLHIDVFKEYFKRFQTDAFDYVLLLFFALHLRQQSEAYKAVQTALSDGPLAFTLTDETHWLALFEKVNQTISVSNNILATTLFSSLLQAFQDKLPGLKDSDLNKLLTNVLESNLTSLGFGKSSDKYYHAIRKHVLAGNLHYYIPTEKRFVLGLVLSQAVNVHKQNSKPARAWYLLWSCYTENVLALRAVAQIANQRLDGRLRIKTVIALKNEHGENAARILQALNAAKTRLSILTDLPLHILVQFASILAPKVNNKTGDLTDIVTLRKFIYTALEDDAIASSLLGIHKAHLNTVVLENKAGRPCYHSTGYANYAANLFAQSKDDVDAFYLFLLVQGILSSLAVNNPLEIGLANQTKLVKNLLVRACREDIPQLLRVLLTYFKGAITPGLTDAKFNSNKDILAEYKAHAEMFLDESQCKFPDEVTEVSLMFLAAYFNAPNVAKILLQQGYTADGYANSLSPKFVALVMGSCDTFKVLHNDCKSMMYGGENGLGDFSQLATDLAHDDIDDYLQGREKAKTPSDPQPIETNRRNAIHAARFGLFSARLTQSQPATPRTSAASSKPSSANEEPAVPTSPFVNGTLGSWSMVFSKQHIPENDGCGFDALGITRDGAYRSMINFLPENGDAKDPDLNRAKEVRATIDKEMRSELYSGRYMPDCLRMLYQKLWDLDKEEKNFVSEFKRYWGPLDNVYKEGEGSAKRQLIEKNFSIKNISTSTLNFDSKRKKRAAAIVEQRTTLCKRIDGVLHDKNILTDYLAYELMTPRRWLKNMYVRLIAQAMDFNVRLWIESGIDGSISYKEQDSYSGAADAEPRDIYFADNNHYQPLEIVSRIEHTNRFT